MSCIICGDYNSERHHIKSRGAGGPDDEWNILMLCRMHHDHAHRMGRTTFIAWFDLVREMERKGWIFDEFFNKWIAPNES